MARRRAAKTIDELLARARATLPDRPTPVEALQAQASGALLIDIREDDRRREGFTAWAAAGLPVTARPRPATTGRPPSSRATSTPGYSSQARETAPEPRTSARKPPGVQVPQ
jgi:hypothetical protein